MFREAVGSASGRRAVALGLDAVQTLLRGCATRFLSIVKCRIETLQPDAGVVGGELPVHLGLEAVALDLPSGDLGAQGLDGVDAAVRHW